MKLVATLFGVLFLSALALAQTTYFVPDDFPTIQGAIDTSANGDTIIVRPGTYVENIDFAGKAITVKSERGAKVTTIDGSHTAPTVRLTAWEGRDSVIDGFTIMNGKAVGYNGGCIVCNRSPTIANNIIKGGSADNGGGIYCEESPLIFNNIIIENFAGVFGGGILCWQNSTAEIVNNVFVRNSAGYGGGIAFMNAGVTQLINCLIFDNSANHGGGIHSTGGPVVSANMIIRNNHAGSNPNIDGNPNDIHVTFSDIEGGWPGTGNVDADPLFVDPVNDDFHLTWDSPCRGTGDNSTVTAATDFEGDPRIAGNSVDMGADEFYFHLYTVGDVVPGGNANVRVVGGPDMYAWLLKGSGIKSQPIQTKYGDLYLEKPIKISTLGHIPTNGVLSIPVTIPTQWNSGEEYPFQALVGAPPWPSSRLTNLMVVTVE